jgi:methylated-DNA-[protein]-cysteine S-methyltransferase
MTTHDTTGVTTTNTTTKTTTMESPIGVLTLAAREGLLVGVHMENQRHGPAGTEAWERDDAAFDETIGQLEAYFAGELTHFDLKLGMGGTEWQRRVWTALLDIPYGSTMSYGELAHHVGNGRASRAVGLANGRNPLAIVVPCHRVIGADGSLTGYGGGLDRKTWLLEHEQTHSSS